MYCRKHSVPRCLVAILSMACVLAVAQPATAQSSREKRGGPLFWGGMELGAANLRRNKDSVQGLGRTNFQGTFTFGVRLNPEWRIGVEGSAIILENIPCAPPDPDTKCEYLSRGFGNLYGMVVFNPHGSPWLLQASLGSAGYFVDEVTDVNYYSGTEYGRSLYSRSGWGGRLGIGYDWSDAGSITHFGVRAGYAFARFKKRTGDVDELSYSGLVLALSVSWY